MTELGHDRPPMLRPALGAAVALTAVLVAVGLWTALELTATRSMFLAPLGAILAAVAGTAACLLVGRLLIQPMQCPAGSQRLVLSFAVGMACLVVVTFVGGLLGRVAEGLVLAIGLAGACTLAARIVPRPHRGTGSTPPLRAFVAGLTPADGLLVGLIVGLSVLVLVGAATPCVEYDTMEYHAGVPAEWSRAGRIVELPRNVYSYFPMAAEMPTLAMMTFSGDAAVGAMAGKTFTASCTVWAAIALACIGRRLFTLRAGLLAAVLYLTVPAIFNVSILGFVEDVQSFYAAAALLAAVILWQRSDAPPRDAPHRTAASPVGPAVLLGVLVGMSLSVKLTGAVFVLVPALVFCAAALATGRLSGRALAAFAAAVAVAGSPFYLRTLVLTGNPVFPVLSTWLGGPDGWTHAMASHFAGHHSPGPLTWQALAAAIVGQADLPPNRWPSFLFGGAALLAAPFALADRRGRRAAAVLLTLVAAAVVVWFCLTHRVMRHLAPAWVLVCLAGGAGLLALRSRPARWALAAAVALHVLLAVMVNLQMLQDRGQYVALLADADAPRTSQGYAFAHPPGSTGQLWTYSPHVVRLINDLAVAGHPTPVVGLIGEARTLYFRVPVIYNTVFDRHWAAPLAAEDLPPETLPHHARELFARLGVTHLYVNWAEVDRFASPGNYGWPAGLRRDLLDRLEAGGVLRRLLSVGGPESLPEHVVYEVVATARDLQGTPESPDAP